jgi:hypothetical protein
MRDSERKRRGLWAVALAAALLMGCAAPITYPVQLAYDGHVPPAADETVAVGIQPFRDRRDTGDRFAVGYRQVGRGEGERERYASSPDDVAQAVTRMTRELIRQKGDVPGELEGWNYTPDQMMDLSKGFDVLVGGDILRLRCNAEKRLMYTRMDLELEIVVYVGQVREGVVHRRPISMRTERVAATFGPRELQQFLNDMLSQALEKGCVDIP